MLSEKVKELIAGGEGLTVEFKSLSAGKLGDSLFETVSHSPTGMVDTS